MAANCYCFHKRFVGPESRLLTGDKKALYALGRHRAHNNHAKNIHTELHGRVICLEASIELCIAQLGFEAVRACVVPQSNCDKAMKVVFSAGLATPEDKAKEALASYIGHEEKTLDADWLWRP